MHEREIRRMVRAYIGTLRTANPAFFRCFHELFQKCYPVLQVEVERYRLTYGGDPAAVAAAGATVLAIEFAALIEACAAEGFEPGVKQMLKDHFNRTLEQLTPPARS